MSKIICIETKKIQNPELFANIIFNNFSYLVNFPELDHSKNSIVKLLKSDNLLCLLIYNVSESNKKLIGYLIAEHKTLGDSRFVAYISYFYIMEKYRNKKLGSRLLEKLIRDSKNNGIKFIILTCDTHDKKITGFYQRHGFTKDPILGNNSRHEVFCLFL